jgi:carboxyl-terminal processing protease
MPRRSLWIVFVVLVVSLACYERADRNPYGRWFSEALETIDRHYLEPVDDQALFEGALSGMVRKLDDYSSFLTRSEAPQFQETLDQQFGGVGIEVSSDAPDKQLTIVNLIAGTPAARSGLQVGDKIVAVDGKTTERLDVSQIVSRLRGKPGEAVVVTVRRTGSEAPLDFHIVRAVIKIDSVRGFDRAADGSWNFLLPGEERLGYVRIDSFGEATLDEFESAMKSLAKQRCRGLILDMRNNPGGLLRTAERISNMFIPAGAVIVSTRGRDGREAETYVADGDGPYQKLPLVVLVNDHSASASEIVAACLQDHRRATVVGERTYGKGTVQSVISLEGGRSLLKLTIASYWRPSGKNIHRLTSSTQSDDWGVRPDPGCEVKFDEKQAANWIEGRRQREARPAAAPVTAGDPPTDPGPRADAGQRFDPQLQRAIDVLNAKLAPPAKAKAA